jgi:hypothetical protein
MISNKLVARYAFLVAATALFAAPAAAQGTAEQRAACTGDAFQFCGSEIPDATRVEVCLRKNLKKISPACQSMFRPTSARAKPPRATPVAAARSPSMHTVY